MARRCRASLAGRPTSGAPVISRSTFSVPSEEGTLRGGLSLIEAVAGEGFKPLAKAGLRRPIRDTPPLAPVGLTLAPESNQRPGRLHRENSWGPGQTRDRSAQAQLPLHVTQVPHSSLAGLRSQFIRWKRSLPHPPVDQWVEAGACREAVGCGAGLPSSCSALSLGCRSLHRRCRHCRHCRHRRGRSCPALSRGAPAR